MEGLPERQRGRQAERQAERQRGRQAERERGREAGHSGALSPPFSPDESGVIVRGSLSNRSDNAVPSVSQCLAAWYCEEACARVMMWRGGGVAVQFHDWLTLVIELGDIIHAPF